MSIHSAIWLRELLMIFMRSSCKLIIGFMEIVDFEAPIEKTIKEIWFA